MAAASEPHGYLLFESSQGAFYALEPYWLGSDGSVEIPWFTAFSAVLLDDPEDYRAFDELMYEMSYRWRRHPRHFRERFRRHIRLPAGADFPRTDGEPFQVEGDVWARRISRESLPATFYLPPVPRDDVNERAFPIGYLGDIVDRLEVLLGDRERTYHAAGRDLQAEYDAAALAEAMVELAIPVPSDWDGDLGAMYSYRAALTLLHVDAQELEDLVDSSAILRLSTVEGISLFPAFQFSNSGDVRRGFRDVLSTFEIDAVSPWTLAGWMVTPAPELANRRPLDLLDSDLDALMAFARESAARFLR